VKGGYQNFFKDPITYKMMKILLIIEATLASAEVSAGAVAKADQK
jgi:hypothetical protein